MPDFVFTQPTGAIIELFQNSPDWPGYAERRVNGRWQELASDFFNTSALLERWVRFELTIGSQEGVR